MALRKSEDEKQQIAAQQAAATYRASPVGQAEASFAQGDRFFQVEIPHSSVKGYSNLAQGQGDVSKVRQHGAAPDMLGRIEQFGWRLESSSWVFVETGQSSRDKVMSSGQRTSITGEVVGIYLFRRAG